VVAIANETGRSPQYVVDLLRRVETLSANELRMVQEAEQVVANGGKLSTEQANALKRTQSALNGSQEAASAAEGAGSGAQAARAAVEEGGAAVGRGERGAASVTDAARVSGAATSAPEVVGATHSPDDLLFPGLTDDEMAFFTEYEPGRSGTLVEAPAQNPRTGAGLQGDPATLVVPEDVPRTGMRQTEVGQDPTKIAYSENKKFKKIKGSPHPTTHVRYHTKNPNAPEGSYSKSNPTIAVNTDEGQFGKLPDGTYKRTHDMTAAERAAATDVRQTKLYRLPDGTWKPLEDMTAAEKAAAHYPAD